MLAIPGVRRALAGLLALLIVVVVSALHSGQSAATVTGMVLAVLVGGGLGVVAYSWARRNRR